MTVPKSSADQGLKIKVICRMENPPNMKHAGYVRETISHPLVYSPMRISLTPFSLHFPLRYLYAMGKLAWKKWKKRYHVLYEVADKLYALCSFKEKKEKKSENAESILLDGYTIDYIEPDKGKNRIASSRRILLRRFFSF